MAIIDKPSNILKSHPENDPSPDCSSASAKLFKILINFVKKNTSNILRTFDLLVLVIKSPDILLITFDKVDFLFFTEFSGQISFRVYIFSVLILEFPIL